MTFWPTRYVFGVRVYRGLDFDKNLYYEEQQAAINARVRGLPQQPGTQMTWTHQRALQRGNTVAVRDSGDERRALQRAARKEAADAARKHWLEKRQSNRAVSNRL